MLHPEYFDLCAQDILNLYNKLEETILADMCRRIARMGRISDATAAQAARLQEAGTLYTSIIQTIAKATNASQKEVKKAFEEAGIEALKIDDGIYKAAGLNPPPLLQSQAMLSVLQAGLVKTNGVMQNLTMTTAVSTQQAYISACNLAYLQVSTGAMDYRTAITRAIVSACKEGTRVLYPSMHTDSLDVAIRRAILTGINQTCGKLQEARADEMECDLVETTAHVGARPSHAVWQGKIFSRSGTSDKYPPFSNTGYGTGAGLCGWNCRHSFFPYFEGLSESAYPRDVLDDYNNRTVVYNGEKMSYYDATQLQRKMERSIRETKRTLKGLDAAIKEDGENLQLKNEFTLQSVKLKEKEAAFNQFLKDTGLQKDTARVWTSGFNRSISQKAVWANKRWGKIHTGLSNTSLEDYMKRFESGLKTADKNAASIIQRALTRVNIKPSENRKSSYNSFYQSISINKKRPPSTLAHELFHSVDNNLDKSYNFNTALQYDYAVLLKKSGGSLYALDKYVRKNYAYAFEVNGIMKEEYGGISDIISGMTKDKLRFTWGHERKYWLEHSSALPREAWANFGETLYINSEEETAMFKELFPNFYKKAKLALKELAHSGKR